MKNKIIIATTVILCAFNAFAQDSQKEMKEIKYRRSSLHTILIESDNFPKKDQVLSAYYGAEFPDKYDNHNIGEKSFNPAKYSSTKEESDTPETINKYMKDSQIAKKLVSKWYNRAADGSFDTSLIEERGAFNASFIDATTAKKANLGNAMISTAGEELLNNTFVVVSKMKFIENEPVARVIRDGAILALSRAPSIVQALGTKAAQLAYEKAKEGYSVWTTSYLYKLKWDDATQNTFFEEMYAEKGQMTPEKKAEYENTDLFNMEFIGSEKATSLVTFSLTEKRTEEQIIKLSVTRNIDKVFSKLQKNYDVFKTKVPLYTGYPITAKIGMKEGLEGGEKFEVLEQSQDLKTGKIEYKRIGKIKVNKKLIWDNRANLSDLISTPANETASTENKSALLAGNENSSSSENKPIDRTTFKGGKKFGAGLLIRQLK